MNCPCGQNSSFWSALGTIHQYSGCTILLCLRIFTISRCFPNSNDSEWNFLFLDVGVNWKSSKYWSLKYHTDYKWQTQVVTFSFHFSVMTASEFRRTNKNTISQTVFTHAPENSGPPMYRIKSFIQQDTFNKSRRISMWLILEVIGHLISHLYN